MSVVYIVRKVMVVEKVMSYDCIYVYTPYIVNAISMSFVSKSSKLRLKIPHHYCIILWSRCQFRQVWTETKRGDISFVSTKGSLQARLWNVSVIKLKVHYISMFLVIFLWFLPFLFSVFLFPLPWLAWNLPQTLYYTIR